MGKPFYETSFIALIRRFRQGNRDCQRGRERMLIYRGFTSHNPDELYALCAGDDVLFEIMVNSATRLYDLVK